MVGQMLECAFIWKFVIAVYSVLYCICGFGLTRTFKSSIALFLLLNRAWKSSTYQRNVLGAMPNVKANSIASFQGSANNSLIRQPLLKC